MYKYQQEFFNEIVKNIKDGKRVAFVHPRIPGCKTLIKELNKYLGVDYIKPKKQIVNKTNIYMDEISPLEIAKNRIMQNKGGEKCEK